jgi:hypothetical protein
MGSLTLVFLAVLSVLCFVAFTRVNVVSNVPAEQEQNGEAVHHRRLTESSAIAENPFMDGVCLDFLQDSKLQITVTKLSVIIVARNEDRSSLLRTVGRDPFHVKPGLFSLNGAHNAT